MFVEPNGHKDSQFLYIMDGPSDFQVEHCPHQGSANEGTIEKAIVNMQMNLEPIFAPMSPGPVVAVNEQGEPGDGPGFAAPLFRIVLLKLPQRDGLQQVAYNVMMSHIIADGAQSFSAARSQARA